MNSRFVGLLLAMSMLGGCAVAPQLPVPLSKEALAGQGSRMGVAMSALPKVDTHLPGAGCLLCLAVASAANHSLTKHAQTLPAEDLAKLRAEAAALLRKNGNDVVVLDQDINVSALPDFGSKEPNFARKNFASIRDRYKIDRLLVVDLEMIGFLRTYSAYIPTADPKAMVRGSAYIVNLKTHALEWFLPVDTLRSAESKWDEPPSFPGLTNAYFQAIEISRDNILKPLSN